MAENVTGNYANTAASDLQDFFNYLDSEEVVNRLAAHGMDISLEPPVRDLTNLQNDSKYRYRAMAEATVSFSQEANGRWLCCRPVLPFCIFRWRILLFLQAGFVSAFI